MANDNRELFIALLKAGLLPERAHEIDGRWSVEDYILVLKTNSFEEFVKEYTGFFVKGIEGNLLGLVEKMHEALNALRYDDPNFPRVARSLLEFLKLTQPIVDKFKQIQAAGGMTINPEELTIVIQPPEGTNETQG